MRINVVYRPVCIMIGIMCPVELRPFHLAGLLGIAGMGTMNAVFVGGVQVTVTVIMVVMSIIYGDVPDSEKKAGRG